MVRLVKLRDSLFSLRIPVLVGLVAALGWVITQTPLWRHAELKLFDYLVMRTAPNQVALPITIIGIDGETFSALNASWPLPRRHHALLLDRLREAGVAVVGFDIAFPEASDAGDDEPFLGAIKRFGNIVLASDLSFREDASVRQWFRVDPHPPFLAAGAAQGYAALQVDEDAVLRRVPTVGDAFWRAILDRFEKANPGVAALSEASEDMRIRYLGGPHTFTFIPYHHVLDPDKHLPRHWREFFKDNIVLVGRNVNVIHDVGAAQAEMYQTPFFSRTREFMPRVEAHANIVANMISGDTLREAPPSWALGTWIVAVLASLFFVRRWHPLRGAIVLATLAGVLAVLEYSFLVQWGIWLPVAGALMTVVLIYVSLGAIAVIEEQRQRRQVRNAFSMYVSPKVVDEVIAHPERLKLGGERRELTILFTDLAGFTSIAERLEPEKVAEVVNRHLSGMTDVVLQYSGTVDKFIGDGIMAFWGAPVADPLQSRRAVLAAIDMQEKMHAMGAEILQETGARLEMRVGIHRGECVVGNMGGDKRFEYTAMGDAINLASRLEGANKVYGTKILASGAVVGATQEGVRFREVDTIRVKGKREGITIYTPCDNRELLSRSAEALAAYRTGEFEIARSAWRHLLERYPHDGVATAMLARVNQFLSRGCPTGWDGVTTLDGK